jgi:hypothetical protein
MGEAEERPWELAGYVRRDCEPHRGDQLHLFGSISLGLGLLSLCVLLPGLVALPLAAVVWVVADRDLARMDAGQLDPRGEGKTLTARSYAVAAVWTSLSVFVFWTFLVLSLVCWNT